MGLLNSNGRLRHAFYMMTLIHIGYKTEFSEFYFRLKEKGKHPKKCLVATARRLAVKCYWGMMKCHES